MTDQDGEGRHQGLDIDTVAAPRARRRAHEGERVRRWLSLQPARLLGPPGHQLRNRCGKKSIQEIGEHLLLDAGPEATKLGEGAVATADHEGATDGYEIVAVRRRHQPYPRMDCHG